MAVEISGKICPKCGSENLKRLYGGNIGELYRCPECDYQGAVALVDKETLPKAIRKRFKKQKAAYARWSKEKKKGKKND